MRLVLLDFAGTIADLDPAPSVIVAEFLRVSCGQEVDHQRVKEAYRVADLIQPYSSVLIRDQLARREYFLRYNALLLEILGVRHCADPAALFQAFVVADPRWVLKPETPGALQQLKELGNSLGLLSNFDSRLNQVVRELKIADLLSFVHVSQSLGIEKPSEHFYQSFLRKHRLEPGDVAYCGDNYSLDYLPAKRIGMNVTLLDELGAYPYLRDAIRTIGELPSRVAARQPSR